MHLTMLAADFIRTNSNTRYDMLANAPDIGRMEQFAFYRTFDELETADREGHVYGDKFAVKRRELDKMLERR